MDARLFCDLIESKIIERLKESDNNESYEEIKIELLMIELDKLYKENIELFNSKY